MHIAFVHDYLTQYGGAERVLEVLYRTYADSSRHVYTSFHAKDRLPPEMRSWNITTSPVGRLPFASRTHRAWLPFYPRIFRQLGESIADADVVIAGSSAWAHHAHPVGDTPHIVYCHSPARFLYGDRNYLDASGMSGIGAALSARIFEHLRNQDIEAAQHPHRVIANSNAVRERIWRFWHREAEVIHPPVETLRFRPPDDMTIQPWFLVVSRLVPHKWIDRAVEASNRTGLPLRIIGAGRDEASLRALAGPQVRFLGQLADEHVATAMQQCQALILPGVEDFGMTAVEAQAAGRPVIAAADGGALETVIDGATGFLVPPGDGDALADAMITATRHTWDRDAILTHAAGFDVRHFERRFKQAVSETIASVTGS